MQGRLEDRLLLAGASEVASVASEVATIPPEPVALTPEALNVVTAPTFGATPESIDEPGGASAPAAGGDGTLTSSLGSNDLSIDPSSGGVPTGPITIAPTGPVTIGPAFGTAPGGAGPTSRPRGSRTPASGRW